jgi:hypothetical protein
VPARDADALVAVSAEGAEISGCACPTPDEVRTTYQRGLFARDVAFKYARFRVAGDAVTYEYRIYEGDQKAQGIPPREGTEVDTVRDGRIVAAIMHPDPASVGGLAGAAYRRGSPRLLVKMAPYRRSDRARRHHGSGVCAGGPAGGAPAAIAAAGFPNTAAV